MNLLVIILSCGQPAGNSKKMTTSNEGFISDAERKTRDHEYLVSQKREQLGSMIDSWILTLNGLRQQIGTMSESTLDASRGVIRQSQHEMDALEALRNLKEP